MKQPHPYPETNTNSTTKKAVIIGSGIAGIASAIRLAVQGFEVEVYEKNKALGGKLSWFQQDGFSFDEGPSLFTQPHNIEALFKLANEPISQYFTYTQLPITCHYFFENGKKIMADASPHQLAKTIQDVLGEDEKTTLQYLEASAKLYHHIGQLFINHSLHKRSTFLKPTILKAIRATKFGHLFQSLHTFNTARFKTEEAVQLFNRFATYNGSNPYKAPAMLSLIPHLEMNEGTFYPSGGMVSIANALVKLAKQKGVQFFVNTPVQRIIENQGKALGVVVNNQNIFADVVVSNSDVYFTYKHLLDNHEKTKTILKQERSSSAFIFYWGINKQFAALGLHNIFFSKNYKQEFEHLFKTKTISEDPTVYINITSKMEASHAQQGGENWFVMINAPNNIGQNWQALAQQIKQSVIEKISRLLGENIAPHIVTESILNPIDIENKTASYQGSLYGTSSNSRLAAFFRHPNFSKKIKGLYFVGGSVHPGGGIPLCLKSAKIMSELVASNHH